MLRWHSLCAVPNRLYSLPLELSEAWRNTNCVSCEEGNSARSDAPFALGCKEDFWFFTVLGSEEMFAFSMPVCTNQIVRRRSSRVTAWRSSSKQKCVETSTIQL